MTTYRRARVNDSEQIQAYCDKNNIMSPVEDQMMQLVYIAEDDNGMIVGVSAVKRWYVVEPVIADNPRIGQVLLEKASSGIPTPEFKCVVKDNELVGALEKYGFIITDKDMTILMKET